MTFSSKEKQKEYYYSHKDKCKEYIKKYREKNKEKKSDNNISLCEFLDTHNFF